MPEDEQTELKADVTYCGPGESFPIRTGKDAADAWNLAGHAADPGAVRACVIRVARQHGWLDQLPQPAQDAARDSKADAGAWETKTIPFVPVAVDDRTVTGIFSVFGVRDAVNDIVHPGSFAHTFKTGAKKALYLWHHNDGRPEPPVAVIKSLREVPREALPADLLAEFPEATGGAEVTREYLDTPRGNELLTAIKAGAPLQQSYGFKVLRYEHGDADGTRVRHVYEQRLGEVSDVLWGANPATRARKAYPSLDSLLAALWEELDAHLQDSKAGARHSRPDQVLIDRIHTAAVQLGATNCMGDRSAPGTDEPPKAAVPDLTPAASLDGSTSRDLRTPLADLKARLDLLDLSLIGVPR